MAESSQDSPETIKGEDWAGEMGAKWLANLDRFEGKIAPIGAALPSRAEYNRANGCSRSGGDGASGNSKPSERFESRNVASR